MPSTPKISDKPDATRNSNDPTISAVETCVTAQEAVLTQASSASSWMSTVR